MAISTLRIVLAIAGVALLLEYEWLFVCIITTIASIAILLDHEWLFVCVIATILMVHTAYQRLSPAWKLDGTGA
jgi:hypothetical protein